MSDPEPVGWNLYGSPSASKPFAFVSASGHILDAIISPPAQPGPPYVHTYVPFEELGQPSRPGLPGRLWRSRCRWHLGQHRPAAITASFTMYGGARANGKSRPPSWQERGYRHRDCANCGRRL